MTSTSPLEVLVGRHVHFYDLTAETARLVTDGGVILAIYNRYMLTHISGKDNLGLVGAQVIHVGEESCSATLEFDTGITLIVDLSDDGYSSPEAMQLIVPGEDIVIWN